MHHYEECGLDNVWLKNGYTFHDTKYGEGISITDIEALHEAIALWLCESSEDLTGREFRFLRVEMNMSQKTLGNMLRVTDQSVAKWEKGEHELPRTVDVVVRALYGAKHDGNSQIADLLSKLNEIDRLDHERSEFSNDDGWKRVA